MKGLTRNEQKQYNGSRLTAHGSRPIYDPSHNHFSHFLKLFALVIAFALIVCTCIPAFATTSLQYVYRSADSNGNVISQTRTANKVNQLISKSEVVLEDSKWYYPYSKTVEITSITVSGDAHLILSKGHTLTVKKGIYVKDGSSLTIYGQPNGDGTLVTTGEGGYAGIGGFNGAAHNAPIAITIHGGNITATGGTGAAGIGVSGGSGINNSITIYGGTITATGGRNGAGIGNNISTVCTTITIYGGEITAAGGTNGAGIGGGMNKGLTNISCGTVNIYGGTITATGSRYGHVEALTDFAEYYPAGIGGGNRFANCAVNIYGGNITAQNYRNSTSDFEDGYGIRGQITLSYKNANDSIYATNYGGAVTVANGKTFIVDGTEISGTVEIVKVEKQLTQTETAIFDTCPALDGKTLIPPSYNVNVGTNRITASTAKAFPGETVTVSPAEGYNLTSVNVNGTAITGNTFTMPANDVTVTATTSLITYTITYDLDGGTVSTANPASYTVETATLTLNNPTKTGYTFAGWSSFAGGVRVVNYTIKQGSTGDKTLIANWTVNQYTLTFDTQGGSEVSAITQDYGSAITAPGNPTKTGCTFAGWSREIPATMPAENLTVKALWTLNQYTLTFDTQGGSEISAVTQDYGSTITPPDNPTKTGYTFGGWYTDSDCANAYDFASVVTGNLTLYAKWTAITYSITYNLDGGSLPEGTSNPETYTVEDSFTLTNPTKDGYTFTGWTLDGSNEDPALTVTVRTGTTGNLAYTANWQKNGFSPKDSETPEFAYHSLILSGQIGVIFHVYAPEGLASKDFCVYFDVSGDKSQNTQPVYAFETMTEDGKNFLGFKCYINSIQMADKIHAELHYKDTNGTERTITHDYTAKQYLSYIIGDTTQADDTRELGRAIMDFGSYVQPVLAKENGWEISKDHAEMTPANDYNDTDFTAADTATQKYAITKTLTDSSGIDEVKFALMLDSETTIILCLIPKSDYNGNVYAYVDDNKTDNMAVKDGNYYTVSIGNISAHELGETHNIEITTQYPNAESNSFTVNISALSYVYSAIQQDDTDMKRAVTSLYRYYDSTMTYRKNRPEIYGTN